MKNLYKKGKKIHPSLPQEPLLSLLPATILTLTTVLSPQDKQVLAYLISCCGATAAADYPGTTRKANDCVGKDGGGGDDHAPTFECNCFRCYTSFWARWDMSPNRQVIHEIIEAYEEWLFQKKKKVKKSASIKKKKRGIHNNTNHNDHNRFEQEVVEKDHEPPGELESAELDCSSTGKSYGEVEEDELEKGTVRKIASFIGDKIWGVWSKN